jgi:hypothetical protein
MGPLFVNCPETKPQIATGIETDAETLAKNVGNDDSRCMLALR